MANKGMEADNYSKCKCFIKRYPKHCRPGITFIMSNSYLAAHGGGGLLTEKLISSCIMQHDLPCHIDHWFRMSYL